MIALGIETFNRDDRFSADVGHRRLARANRLAIDMNSAGAAGGDATSELGSSHAQDVPEIPQHRHRWISVEFLLLPIHT